MGVPQPGFVRSRTGAGLAGHRHGWHDLREWSSRSLRLAERLQHQVELSLPGSGQRPRRRYTLPPQLASELAVGRRRWHGLREHPRGDSFECRRWHLCILPFRAAALASPGFGLCAAGDRRGRDHLRRLRILRPERNATEARGHQSRWHDEVGAPDRALDHGRARDRHRRRHLCRHIPAPIEHARRVLRCPRRRNTQMEVRHRTGRGRRSTGEDQSARHLPRRQHRLQSGGLFRRRGGRHVGDPRGWGPGLETVARARQ